jgi:hypothetical protein
LYTFLNKIFSCADIDTRNKNNYYWKSSSESRDMGYKTPTYKQPAKFPLADGSATPTKMIRMPMYLAEELEAIAKELHQRRVAEGTVPLNPVLRGCDRND